VFEMCWDPSDSQVELERDDVPLRRQTRTILGHSFLWAALANSCLPGEEFREYFLKKLTHTPPLESSSFARTISGTGKG